MKIVIPSDASYAAYYDQAISKYAPDPAAARLWEEYLYSTAGQNLWLQGEARPIELSTLVTRRHGQRGGLQGAAAGSGRQRSPSRPRRSKRRPRTSSPSSGPAWIGWWQVAPSRPGSRRTLASGAGPAGVSSVARAALARWLGVVPFGVYVTLGLLLPMVAVAIGAFKNATAAASR